MKASGRVFKYGDNVDTDVIIPARYLNATKGEELAKHCMEDIDKDFVNKVQKGDIIVANKNFGCGSSREHAPLAIKCAGVSCVIAETFARIFYRNARLLRLFGEGFGLTGTVLWLLLCAGRLLPRLRRRVGQQRTAHQQSGHQRRQDGYQGFLVVV